jgi:DNA-directed RNA polymerase specialized sigma subunit
MEEEYLLSVAMEKLPDLHKQILSMYYDIAGNKTGSISHICKELSLSRAVCIKTLEEAQVALKSEFLKLI